MSENRQASDWLKAWLVLAATAGTVAFYGLAATGRVNGVTPAVILTEHSTIVTPAGYAFTIWFLIYAGMIAFSIYQLLPSKIERFTGVRSIYILSCVLNCGWIFFWHREMIGVCLMIIFGLGVTLLIINIKLNPISDVREVLLTKAPFGLYFGWVTVAAIVNFVVFLVGLGVTTSSSAGLGVTMSRSAWNILGSGLIVAAMVCSLIVRVKLRNFLYPLAVAWGLTAIAVQQQGNTMVILVSAICVVVCLVLSLSFVMDLPSSTHE
jgi:hypothetical protein